MSCLHAQQRLTPSYATPSSPSIAVGDLPHSRQNATRHRGWQMPFPPLMKMRGGGWIIAPDPPLSRASSSPARGLCTA